MAYPDVSAAVYSKLNSGTAITALVGTRIYFQLAPPSVALPYLVHYPVSAIFPNDHAGQRLDTVYSVEAVATTRQTALQIAQAVYDHVHLQDLAISGDWAAWWVSVDSKLELADVLDGVTYYRAVQDIRLRIDG